MMKGKTKQTKVLNLMRINKRTKTKFKVFRDKIKH